MALAEDLRNAVDGLRLTVHCGGGSVKSAMKKADKSGAAVALILGEEELARETVALKPLRSDTGQASLARGPLIDMLTRTVASAGQ